ncbi:MAG: ABC transporter permease [Acidobacteria bacterium]|nr:ABC transporter permease [Acidobacteriota bacterium]
MAVCIIILLWVRDEISYDKFHDNSDSLYMVCEKTLLPSGDIEYYGQTPMLLSQALRDDYPEVKTASIYWRRMLLFKRPGGQAFTEKGCLVEPQFLEMFSIEFVKGVSKSVGSDLRAIAISEKMADKYFGNEDPIGKSLQVTAYPEEIGDFKVVAVFRYPQNSCMQFDFIAPFVLKYGGYGEKFDKWDLDDFDTFVQLNDGVTQLEFERTIAGLKKKHIPEAREDFFLIPVSNIHLDSRIWSPDAGSMKDVYIFSTLAILVLIIACINYINLTNAQAFTRMKEIGIRKVAGAGTKDIMKQFFIESLLTSLLALFIGIILVIISLPYFSEIAGKDLKLFSASSYSMPVEILLLALFAAALSGLYPAYYISSFNIQDVIKGKISVGSNRAFLRKALVLFQFAASVFLIIGTLVISSQVDYLNNRDLGFHKENVIILNPTAGIVKNWVTFWTEMQRYPGIENITVSNTIPGMNESTTDNIDWEGRTGEAKTTISIVGVYWNFTDTLGMKMKEGRFFDQTIQTDITESFVLNESAVKAFGLSDPIGKWFKVLDRRGKIIGVVKDYNHRNLKDSIDPMVFYFGYGLDTVLLRYKEGNLENTVSFLEGTYKKLAPDDTFSYKFLDDSLKKEYRAEQQMGSLFRYFAMFAVLISCMGLFGLTLYAMQRKTKEIGIRKVNGATVGNLLRYLLKESTIWVLLANIIAWPLAHIALTGWLENFAYRVSINPLYFVFASVLVYIISVLVTIYQTYKAASLNPIKALRYE